MNKQEIKSNCDIIIDYLNDDKYNTAWWELSKLIYAIRFDNKNQNKHVYYHGLE